MLTNNTRKYINILAYLSYLAGLFYLILPTLANAFCPVCTVAAGAGVGLARYFGVDDTISGLWIGGLMVAVSIWTIEWFKKNKYYFSGLEFITVFVYYALLIIPFYQMGVIGHILNTIWGFDKLLLGIVIGSITFYLGGVWYQQIKAKRGQAHFPFQKVVMPVSPLIILSLLFYLLTK